MIELREYQSELVSRCGLALRRSRRVLIVLPPGGGKTVIAAFIAQRFALRGSITYFNCHRNELLKQTSGTFASCGLSHAFIASGYSMNKASLSQICSIDTLKHRLSKISEPKVVIWDECHHIGAAGWAAIMAAWPNAFHIGLTGTPWRLDGTGLGEYFDEMILGPSVADLMAAGNLANYELYAPDKPDMKGVRKQMGDYKKADTEEKMRKPKLTGNMVKHWREHANGLLTVGYAVNVGHSLYLTDNFNASGIRAVHLDGGTDDGERKRVISRFANGDLDVIFNVGLFGEGFDLAAWAGKPVRIGATILADPTQSLSKYLQEAMRCMRPGGRSVILDHAGNSDRHGFPDDDREWSLEGQPKGKAANDNAPPPPMTCEGCFIQIRRPVPLVCPSCGKRLIVEQASIEVDEETQLKLRTEEDRIRQRDERKREQAQCKSLDELVSLGKQRGHKHPFKWAQHVLSARHHKNVA